MPDDVRLVGVTGPQSSAVDGTNQLVGMSRDGALRVVQAHTRRAEAAQRGKLYAVSTAQAGVTIIAEMAGTIAADKKTILSVWNPYTSGIDLHVHAVCIGHISGTPGVGAFALQTSLNNSAMTGTANITPRNLRTGTAGNAQGFSNTATTGSAAHVLTLNLPCAPFAGALAATHTSMSPMWFDVDGALIVPPGGFCSIAAAATGTSHVVSASILYEEVAYTGA